GRSSKNAIVLPSSAISREHSLLLRMPSREPGKYMFRLIDGNASGKPSLNGFTVNGEKCSVRDLKNGDQIIFGGTIEVTYQVKPAGNISPEDAKQTVEYQDSEMLNTMVATSIANGKI
ncbi:MAG: FHA domain-containing protein, partial [Cyanobacteria bacterium P01_F01_bin.42]